MTPETVAKNLDNRPGYELVAYREVGLPVFRLHATAVLIDVEERSCIEEFALRAIAAGLQSTMNVQGILGLPASVMDVTWSELIRQELIETMSGGDNVSLTSRGLAAIETSELTRPFEQEIWFTYDRLLRRPEWYGMSELLKPSETDERGLLQLRGATVRGTEVGDISAEEVSKVIRQAMGAARVSRTVLRIVSVEKRVRLFLPAVALAYRSWEGSDIQIAFATEGRLRHEHELAFSRENTPDAEGLFADLKHRTVVGPIDGGVSEELGRVLRLSAERRDVAAIATARSSVDRAALARVTAQSESERAIAIEAEKQARERLKRSEDEFAREVVRPLPVYEHPGVLEGAVGTATARLVILSPWIRRAVVSDAFLDGLRKACVRGVKISIGFGLGESDLGERPSDTEARRKLERLSEECALLDVRRLGDTHAKVLVKDSEFYVVTSFNWLSFRGDPSKPFREEWGTLIRDANLVDQFYEQIIKRFGSADGR